MAFEHELRMMGNGANCHTTNKALFYLEKWKKDNPQMYEWLSEKVEMAIQTKDWKPVSEFLRRCW